MRDPIVRQQEEVTRRPESLDLRHLQQVAEHLVAHVEIAEYDGLRGEAADIDPALLEDQRMVHGICRCRIVPGSGPVRVMPKIRRAPHRFAAP